MTNLVTGAQAIDFLREFLRIPHLPKPPLGKAFIEKFEIPVPSLLGLEVFGYCAATDLYRAEDDAYAIKLIFTQFVQELVRE
jgi:hypothetical protein